MCKEDIDFTPIVSRLIIPFFLISWNNEGRRKKNTTKRQQRQDFFDIKDK